MPVIYRFASLAHWSLSFAFVCSQLNTKLGLEGLHLLPLSWCHWVCCWQKQSDVGMFKSFWLWEHLCLWNSLLVNLKESINWMKVRCCERQRVLRLAWVLWWLVLRLVLDWYNLKLCVINYILGLSQKQADHPVFMSCEPKYVKFQACWE